jgi:hypothetical protein
MTPSVVLSRPSLCNVLQGYASVAELPAALLGCHFEHPAGELSPCPSRAAHRSSSVPKWFFRGLQESIWQTAYSPDQRGAWEIRGGIVRRHR